MGTSRGDSGTRTTSWTSFTPTGSWTSNTTYAGSYRLVGDELSVRVRMDITGTPTNANLTINLPTGWIINTSAIPGTNLNNAYWRFGYAILRDEGAAGYMGSVDSYNSTSLVRVTTSNITGTYPVHGTNISNTVPFTWANTDKITIHFSVPVVAS